jgi:hypothetical protein
MKIANLKLVLGKNGYELEEGLKGCEVGFMRNTALAWRVEERGMSGGDKEEKEGKPSPSEEAA